MKRLIIFSCLILCGCTSLSTYHDDCMKVSQPFAQQVACVKNGAANDHDAATKDYLATADQLVIQVKTGLITQDAARTKLQDKLIDIQESALKRQADEALIMRQQDRQFPTFTDCNRGGGLDCVTY